MRVTIKILQEEVKRERRRGDEWRDKYHVLQADHFRLRTWISRKFDWWLELVSTQKTPCFKYLIKDTAEILGMKP